MVIFKSREKKFEDHLKMKLCGKRLYPPKSVKYLGVKLIQILVGNVILMTFPSTQIWSMLSFSK